MSLLNTSGRYIITPDNATVTGTGLLQNIIAKREAVRSIDIGGVLKEELEIWYVPYQGAFVSQLTKQGWRTHARYWVVQVSEDRVTEDERRADPYTARDRAIYPRQFLVLQEELVDGNRPAAHKRAFDYFSKLGPKQLLMMAMNIVQYPEAWRVE